MANPDVNLESVKTLVALHGQRKAARMAGLNENTVRSWAMRYHWKIAKPLDPQPETNAQPVRNQSPADIVVNEIEQSKNTSKLHLARYVAKASTEASAHPRKLTITRKAKDLADIHGTLFPEADNRSTILNVAILTGTSAPPKQIASES